jgi:glycerophosphoryl diester phosphodiesterase
VDTGGSAENPGGEQEPLTSVIAHRGFSGAWPENTVPAFRAAVAAGCHMIELDARRTRGDRLAVVHDDDLTRYGHPGRRVSGLDLAELELLDAGSWFAPGFAGTRFLGLAEALTTIAGRVPVNVEIKVDEGQEAEAGALVDAALAEVAHAGSPGILLSTFSMIALRRLRRAAPALPAALLIGRTGDPTAMFAELADLAVEGLHLPLELARPELIQAARARGLKLRVYTVNDSGDMQRLLSQGLDGIFTDWPDRLLAAQRRSRGR